MRTHDEKLGTAREILDGLSVGDALGESLGYQHLKPLRRDGILRS